MFRSHEVVRMRYRIREEGESLGDGDKDREGRGLRSQRCAMQCRAVCKAGEVDLLV